jgi:5-deoxy-glucuronate isomerase
VTGQRLHFPHGALATGPWTTELTAERAGWSFTSLRVLVLDAGASLTFESGEEEVLVLPLEGSCVVGCADERFELAGRAGVFAGLTDFVYVGRHAVATLWSDGGGRIALPGAVARRDLPFRYGTAGDVAVELRGKGSCSRQVNNLFLQDSFEADRLMVCDEDRPGECELEEIYYFEVAEGPSGPGIGYQRVYGTAARPIDLLAEVRTGDVVLVPHGWHGPSMAAPGYDLYYLNVMAGPGERSWLICDDPAHAWVRASWDGEALDARLPFYGHEVRSE